MYESFSQDTKNEMSAVKIKMQCCRISMLYGMIYGAGYFAEDRIIFDTENPAVFITYSKLIKDLTGMRKIPDAELSDISSPELLEKLFCVIGISEADGIYNIKTDVMKCDLCKWSFVRGVYLSCATVTRPDNAYHLEFLMRDKTSASQFSSYLDSLGMTGKITERAGNLWGVYFKDSENIVDLLGHLGANKASFDMLNVKIYKDLRNNANRIANCETANIEKTINASNQQMRAIEKIIELGKEDELPDELRQTLDLRAAFPDVSLNELALMHKPPITKSGVNHRLKRIIDFSLKC